MYTLAHEYPIKESVADAATKVNLAFLPSLPAISAQILQVINLYIQDTSPNTLKQRLQKLHLYPEYQKIAVITHTFMQKFIVPCITSLANIQTFDELQAIFLELQISFGLSLIKKFHQPGKTEFTKFWLHALNASICMVTLNYTRKDNINFKSVINLEFLAGFMHNFGLLMFGLLFPPEFTFLNKLSALKKMPIEELERKLLGFGSAKNIVHRGHANFGANLMEFWDMPEVIAVTCREHHNADYKYKYISYVKMLYCINQELKVNYKLGDGDYSGVPDNLFSELGIDNNCFTKVMANTLNHTQNLETILQLLF